LGWVLAKPSAGFPVAGLAIPDAFSPADSSSNCSVFGDVSW
jgi:hypothetical protein